TTPGWECQPEFPSGSIVTVDCAKYTEPFVWNFTSPTLNCIDPAVVPRESRVPRKPLAPVARAVPAMTAARPRARGRLCVARRIAMAGIADMGELLLRVVPGLGSMEGVPAATAGRCSERASAPRSSADQVSVDDRAGVDRDRRKERHDQRSIGTVQVEDPDSLADDH